VIPGALLLGAALYLILFGFVVRAHEETRIKNSLLVGFGLALALHALAVRLWTADDRSISTDYGGMVFTVGPISIPVIRLASLLVALALIAGLHLLLARWRWGKAIRATAEDWQAALLTGIDIRRAYLLAFALGTALAGAAGTLVSVGYSISPSIGLEWTLKALIVVVLAGLGSMLGTFVAGLFVGVAEALSAAAFGGPYREVVGLVIFLVVLVLRAPVATPIAPGPPAYSSRSLCSPSSRSSPLATTCSTSRSSSCSRSRWPRAGTSSRATPAR
jgi:branched-chain amino acid transport system permease protein